MSLSELNDNIFIFRFENRAGYINYSTTAFPPAPIRRLRRPDRPTKIDHTAQPCTAGIAEKGTDAEVLWVR